MAQMSVKEIMTKDVFTVTSAMPGRDVSIQLSE